MYFNRISGTIASLGAGVDENKWKVGQNVTVCGFFSTPYFRRVHYNHFLTFSYYREPLISCLKESCACCASGAWSTCPSTTFIVRTLVSNLCINHLFFAMSYRELADGVAACQSIFALDTCYVHILPEGISRTLIPN